MSLRARSGAWLLACLFAAASPQAAEPPTAKPDAADGVESSLAGHYYLSGVMETGSELLLRPDGRFQWYLSYGAADLTAEGRWQRDGGFVALEPEATDGPAQFPEMRFQRMRLRIDGDGLVPAWPWEDGAERGRYTRE